MPVKNSGYQLNPSPSQIWERVFFMTYIEYMQPFKQLFILLSDYVIINQFFDNFENNREKQT